MDITTEKLTNLRFDAREVYAKLCVAGLPSDLLSDVETLYLRAEKYTENRLQGLVSMEDHVKVLNQLDLCKDTISQMKHIFWRVHDSMSSFINEEDMQRIDRIHAKDYKVIDQ